jgi:predicted RNA-binding Zn-ribbon protein involved in translation (DUF1610 family)
MAFPVKTCSTCGEQFELKPDKPGFANRCPDCTEQEVTDQEGGKIPKNAADAKQKIDREANAARREAMRNLLYRKDS